MNDRGSEVWERQDFPPWSIKVLLLGTVGILVLSGIVGGLVIYVVSYVDSHYNLELNTEERFFLFTMPSYVIYMGLTLAFIVLQLKKNLFTLKDVWVSSKIQPSHIGVGLLIGVILISLQILVSKATTGQVPPPPLSEIRFDWRFTLGIELLAKASIVGFVEEIFFRGLVYRTLRIHFQVTKATLFSAIIFALFHLDFILNPLAMTYVFLFGIVAAVLFERTKSLNTCVAFHFANNTTEPVIRYMTYVIPFQQG